MECSACKGVVLPVVVQADKHREQASYFTGEMRETQNGAGIKLVRYHRYRCTASECHTDHTANGEPIVLYPRPSGLWRGTFVDGEFIPFVQQKKKT